ncbi:hypothetical protein B0H65DRAFT_115319 [Neurospora tetraspora]|uniref:Uncharacterized protein n=1 Tax=Neurospora tetraspora TaxID=94610 RepID=A0AAE0MUD0_9PEZI|nr:hypothetical protein B0H65DRAFT_115319 [Neurospora tetraspora]
MTTVRMQPASNDCRESKRTHTNIDPRLPRWRNSEGKIPCRGNGCNLHRIPDGRDPAELAYNYHIWACWTESARPANNRSTRLHPSHEMPRSERVLDVLSSSTHGTSACLKLGTGRDGNRAKRSPPLPRDDPRTDLGTSPSFEGVHCLPSRSSQQSPTRRCHYTAPQPRASPSTEPERTRSPGKRSKRNQVSHTGRTGALGTNTIRLRASGSGTTLPQTMWLKPDSATWDPRRGAIRPPSSLALTQKTVVTQLRVKRRPIMAGRSSRWRSLTVARNSLVDPLARYRSLPSHTVHSPTLPPKPFLAISSERSAEALTP